MEAEHGARTPHVVPITNKIKGDEKAWMLVERNLLTRDYKELRRWQFIYVNRGDVIHEWCRDLGMAKSYPDCSEFRLVSLWQDEVDELMDQALEMRNESREFRARLYEHRASSTLTTDYTAWLHERGKQLRNQSVFGPGFSRQRNLFARKA